VSILDVIAGKTRWHVERGEAMALLASLPDACIDAVVTDSPYSSGGQFRGDRSGATSQKYQQNGTKLERPEFGGDTRDQRAFAYWCTLWLSECLRVARPGSPICLFTDWRQLPTSSDALQAGGWIWRGIVPWDKTEGARPQMGRFRAQAEYVVWGSAGAIPPRQDVGVLPGYFHHFLKHQDKHHLAGKPVEVMQEIVRICPPGGLVLDPFAGSGTTVVAAMLEGRRGLGFELTSQNHAIAVARCANVAMGNAPAPAELAQLSLLGGERR
jgi:site-specific DNA-methyltransferase (adenine-specific)